VDFYPWHNSVLVSNPSKFERASELVKIGKEASKNCPIIFSRPFLNTFGVVIDCKKENFFTKFNGESYEFNFSKFAKTSYENELPNEIF
jgi:hypothetical protein